VGTSPPPGGGTPQSNQELAKQLAAKEGHQDWTTGQQWTDWVQLWTKESSWNQNALNPSSQALGIAQALDHGNKDGSTTGTKEIQGKKRNEYGTDTGISVQQAIAANNCEAGSQILWGIGYIAQRYKDPSAAWAHETKNNWY